MNIANKTILITGTSRGLGRALVNEALRRGAKRVYAGTRNGVLEHTDKRVIPLKLDVTNLSQIKQAAEEVDTLDVLINNAGMAIFEDLSNAEVIVQHFDVNLLGMFRMVSAFLPLLKHSNGAIVNNLSVAALAPIPVLPAYSVSKAAAFNMTQSLRMLLGKQGVTVHGVLIGAMNTDMIKALDIPKTSPERVAMGIFDGLERGEEDIFPDPLSQTMAEGWRTSVAKAFERQNAALV
jgi:NAD(P)-dependent dehydrogenase (short-subunit alcohol dehydrogenase family)